MGYLFSDPDKGIVYGGDLKVPFGLEDCPANFSESRGLYVAPYQPSPGIGVTGDLLHAACLSMKAA